MEEKITPTQSIIKEEIQDVNNEEIEIPKTNNAKVKIPKETKLNKEIPEQSNIEIKEPDDFNKDNSVFVKGKWLEIKPTKLKYFRNRTASIYSVLKILPLNEFLAYEKGTFDENRDSDQILFDFLCAVFDDSSIVRNYYDEFTSDDIEKILSIFGRINHIDEKEEKARKNREAQMTH